MSVVDVEIGIDLGTADGEDGFAQERGIGRERVGAFGAQAEVEGPGAGEGVDGFGKAGQFLSRKVHAKPLAGGFKEGIARGARHSELAFGDEASADAAGPSVHADLVFPRGEGMKTEGEASEHPCEAGVAEGLEANAEGVGVESRGLLEEVGEGGQGGLETGEALRGRDGKAVDHDGLRSGAAVAWD